MMSIRTIAIAACLLTTGTPAFSKAAIQDLKSYAFAECLIRQRSSDYLRDQGYALGAIVMTRTGGAAMNWKPLAAAIRAELARQPALTVHGDGPVNASDKPAPVAQCFELIESRTIKTMIVRLTR